MVQERNEPVTEKNHENDFENDGNRNLDLRVCDVTSRYAVNAVYVENPAWYAVRAYYMGGPWSGPGYSYAGWDDYAARSGIGCRPGTAIKGGDGIMYNCQ
jgi:hypothetical protein